MAMSKWIYQDLRNEGTEQEKRDKLRPIERWILKPAGRKEIRVELYNGLLEIEMPNGNYTFIHVRHFDRHLVAYSVVGNEKIEDSWARYSEELSQLPEYIKWMMVSSWGEARRDAKRLHSCWLSKKVRREFGVRKH